jgi:drug/metabolite transporter (DMT)-like permease
MNSRAITLSAPGIFVVLWSSAFIAGIVGVGAAPPMMVLSARFLLGGLALVGYAWVVRARRPRGRELGHAVVAGLLMQMTQFGGFYTAMHYHVTGAVLALIQGLNPVVIALLANPVLGERVSVRQWVGFGLGGVGVAMAVSAQGRLSVAGIGLCVVGLLGLSLGTVYQKRFTPGIDSRAATAIHTLASAPIAGVLAVATHSLHVARPAAFAETLAWMVVVNSMAAFLLLNAMLSWWDTTRVAKLFFAVPAVTTVMAWLAVGQTPRALTIAGLAVGVLGMVYASGGVRLPRRRAAAAPAPTTVPCAVSASGVGSP